MERNLPELRNLSDMIVNEGSGFITNAEAERYVSWLLDVQSWASDTLARLKTAMKEKAVDFDPNFTGVTGENVKIEFRAFGAEYKLSKDFTEDDYDPAFMTRKVETKYSINSSAVSNYFNETGELPRGIERCEREKQIVIKGLKS